MKKISYTLIMCLLLSATYTQTFPWKKALFGTAGIAVVATIGYFGYNYLYGTIKKSKQYLFKKYIPKKVNNLKNALLLLILKGKKQNNTTTNKNNKNIDNNNLKNQNNQTNKKIIEKSKNINKNGTGERENNKINKTKNNKKLNFDQKIICGLIKQTAEKTEKQTIEEIIEKFENLSEHGTGEKTENFLVAGKTYEIKHNELNEKFMPALGLLKEKQERTDVEKKFITTLTKEEKETFNTIFQDKKNQNSVILLQNLLYATKNKLLKEHKEYLKPNNK